MVLTSPSCLLDEYSSKLLSGHIVEALAFREKLLDIVESNTPLITIDTLTRDRLLLECTKTNFSDVILSQINTIRSRYSLPVFCDPHTCLITSQLNPHFSDDDSPSDLSLWHVSSKTLLQIQSSRDAQIAKLVEHKKLLLIGPCPVSTNALVKLIEEKQFEVVIFFSLFTDTDIPGVMQGIISKTCSIISYLNGVKANHLESMVERMPSAMKGSTPIFYQLRRWSWLCASYRFRAVYLANIPLSPNGGLQLTNALHDLMRYNFRSIHVIGCNMYSSGPSYSSDYIGYSRIDPQSFQLPAEFFLKRLLTLHDPLGDFRFLRAILKFDKRVSFEYNYINPRIVDDIDYLDKFISSSFL